MDQKFIKQMMELGIMSYREQETLWSIAKRCAKTSGLPLGVAVGAATAGVGAVVVPGIGSVPGYVAGALAGMVSGTFSCTLANATLKDQLKKLAQGY